MRLPNRGHKNSSSEGITSGDETIGLDAIDAEAGAPAAAYGDGAYEDGANEDGAGKSGAALSKSTLLLVGGGVFLLVFAIVMFFMMRNNDSPNSASSSPNVTLPSNTEPGLTDGVVPTYPSGSLSPTSTVSTGPSTSGKPSIKPTPNGDPFSPLVTPTVVNPGQTATPSSVVTPTQSSDPTPPAKPTTTKPTPKPPVVVPPPVKPPAPVTKEYVVVITGIDETGFGTVTMTVNGKSESISPGLTVEGEIAVNSIKDGVAMMVFHSGAEEPMKVNDTKTFTVTK